MCAVKIGWAKRDISTTEPVFINGQMYLRISEGILDPIMVTALCIDGGEGQDAAIFVSCDITGLYGGAMDFIREKLKKLTHIPVENVVVNANGLGGKGVAVVADERLGGGVQNDGQRAVVILIGDLVHLAVVHEGEAEGRVAHHIDLLLGEVFLDDVLHTNLTTHCITVGMMMTVNNDRIMFFYRF